MFRSFGWPEAVIILVVVLIIFGAGKLPQIGGAIGKSIKEFRKAKSEAVDEGKDKAVTQGSAPKEITQGGTKTKES
ncbi:MAG: twin-arginine translocase TatA/TatE family subunit [Chloroflexi bacterium]|nr:twin-arginine translocase TatA/TatE family subunit [Chloroflexota bacterium]